MMMVHAENGIFTWQERHIGSKGEVEDDRNGVQQEYFTDSIGKGRLCYGTSLVANAYDCLEAEGFATKGHLSTDEHEAREQNHNIILCYMEKFYLGRR